jgi:hypothetical protein
MCLSRFSFLVIFRALSLRFSWSDFEAFHFFWIWWGCMLEPFMVLLHLIPVNTKKWYREETDM